MALDSGYSKASQVSAFHIFMCFLLNLWQNVTDSKEASRVHLWICIRIIWVTFYIINHHFLRHSFTVIWRNWTTEGWTRSCAVHNKQSRWKSISISCTVAEAHTLNTLALFSNWAFWVRHQTTQVKKKKEKSQYVSLIWGWIIVIINDLWALTRTIWWTSEANFATASIYCWGHPSLFQIIVFKGAVVSLVAQYVCERVGVCLPLWIVRRCIAPVCFPLMSGPCSFVIHTHTHQPVQRVWTCKKAGAISFLWPLPLSLLRHIQIQHLAREHTCENVR